MQRLRGGILGLFNNRVGKNIVLLGNESKYIVNAGDSVRLIIRLDHNNTNPLDIMRVVKFKAGKKNRKV